MITRVQAEAMALLPVSRRWWREVVAPRTATALKTRGLVEVTLTGDVVLTDEGRGALAEFRAARPGVIMDRPRDV